MSKPLRWSLPQVDIQYLDGITGYGVMKITGYVLKLRFYRHNFRRFEDRVRRLIGQSMQANQCACIGNLSSGCELDVDVLRNG